MSQPSRSKPHSTPTALFFVVVGLLACLAFFSSLPSCTYQFDLTNLACDNDNDCQPLLKCLPNRLCGTFYEASKPEKVADAKEKQAGPEPGPEPGPEAGPEPGKEAVIELPPEPKQDTSSDLPGLGERCTRKCRDGLYCTPFPGPLASHRDNICLLACNTADDCTNYCKNSPSCSNYKGSPNCSPITKGPLAGKNLCFWNGCTENKDCFADWICKEDSLRNLACIP